MAKIACLFNIFTYQLVYTKKCFVPFSMKGIEFVKKYNENRLLSSSGGTWKLVTFREEIFTNKNVQRIQPTNRGIIPDPINNLVPQSLYHINSQILYQLLSQFLCQVPSSTSKGFIKGEQGFNSLAIGLYKIEITPLGTLLSTKMSFWFAHLYQSDFHFTCLLNHFAHFFSSVTIKTFLTLKMFCHANTTASFFHLL